MTDTEGRQLRASYLQRILCIMRSVRGGQGMLNVPAIYRMRGPLDSAALSAAMDRVVARHDALRTVVTAQGTDVVQTVRSPRPGTIGATDLTAERDTAAAIEKTIRAATTRDIAEGELPFTADLYRLDTDDHLLLLTIDHLVTDAWSNMVIGRDLGAYYNHQLGAGSEPPSVSWQFQDFVRWERRHLRGSAADYHRDFWSGELAGVTPFSLRPSPERQRGRPVPAENVWFTLSSGELELLADVGRRSRCSLFVVLLSIFYAVLYQLSGRLDIPISSVFANRAREEVHQTAGLFANMVVLRAELPERPSFGDVLSAVRRTVMRALDHQEYPFTKVRRLVPDGGQLASTVFHMLAVPVGCAQPGCVPFHNLDVQPVRITEGPASRFDLELLIIPAAGGADGLLRYAADQFDREYVSGLARAYQAMARRVLADPSFVIEADPSGPAVAAGQPVSSQAGR